MLAEAAITYVLFNQPIDRCNVLCPPNEQFMDSFKFPFWVSVPEARDAAQLEELSNTDRRQAKTGRCGDWPTARRRRVSLSCTSEAVAGIQLG